MDFKGKSQVIGIQPLHWNLESVPPFEIGTRVQLRGLAGRRFSGLEVEGDERGIIKRFSATSGLYSVKFEDGRGPYNIKPENLIEIP